MFKDLLTPWLTGHLTYLPACLASLACLCWHSHACTPTLSAFAGTRDTCALWHKVPRQLTRTQLGLCSCGHHWHMSPPTHGLDPVAGIQNTIPHLHIHKIGRPLSMKRVRKDFHKKNRLHWSGHGQVSVCIGKLFTYNWSFYSFIFLLFFLRKLPWSLPFTTLSYSPKHLIISPAQSPNALSLNTIMCPEPLRSDLPQSKRCPCVDLSWQMVPSFDSSGSFFWVFIWHCALLSLWIWALNGMMGPVVHLGGAAAGHFLGSSTWYCLSLLLCGCIDMY